MGSANHSTIYIGSVKCHANESTVPSWKWFQGQSSSSEAPEKGRRVKPDLANARPRCRRHASPPAAPAAPATPATPVAPAAPTAPTAAARIQAPSQNPHHLLERPDDFALAVATQVDVESKS